MNNRTLAMGLALTLGAALLQYSSLPVEAQSNVKGKDDAGSRSTPLYSLHRRQKLITTESKATEKKPAKKVDKASPALDLKNKEGKPTTHGSGSRFRVQAPQGQ